MSQKSFSSLWLAGGATLSAALVGFVAACGGSPTTISSIEAPDVATAPQLGDFGGQETVTLFFDGNPESFLLKDFAIALALLVNPEADFAAIDQFAQDVFGLTLDEETDVMGAGNPLAQFDLNGDGETGTLADLGVALAALLAVPDFDAAEALCQSLMFDCTINREVVTELPGRPGAQLPSPLPLPLQGDPDVMLSGDPTAFTVQVLHAGDQEGGVDAIEFAPRFSAVINGLRAQIENTLSVASGDLWIPGPFYNASLDIPNPNGGFRPPGFADVVINNALGFQVSVLGNHEFDQGTNALAALIRLSNFPYLSANLDFTPNGDLNSSENPVLTDDGQPADTIPGRIAKTTTLTLGGETFGVVGATTPLLPNISSPGNVIVNPPNSMDIPGLATIIQQEVDALTAQGINKVILLAHLQQIENEIRLAGLLRDVDIIVAGGSDTLLANPEDRVLTQFGKPVSGVYPLLFNSATDEPVALVNTDREYRYVGRLIAGFDAAGILTEIDERSGAYAADEAGIAVAGGAAPSQEVVEIVGTIRDIIIASDSNIFGVTTEFLNGERQDVRTRETNLGNLSADANLFAARQADPTVAISIKNGGGIRSSIGAVLPGDEPLRVPPLANPISGKMEGEVSQLDIQNALRFNNTLTLLTVSREGLKDILEHGVANIGGGQTIQVGGLSFSFNPMGSAIVFDADGSVLTPGTRVQNVSLIDENGDSTTPIVVDGVVVPGDDIRLVTLNFLANASSANPGLGGDRYPFPALGSDVVPLAGEGDGITLEGGEQKAIADFLTEIGTFMMADPVDPANRNRIQNLSLRADTVLEGAEDPMLMVATVQLTTAAEVPPVNPDTPDTSMGEATIVLDPTGRTVRISGSFSGLSTPPVVVGPSVMHAHVIEADPMGEQTLRDLTGPVSFGLDVTLSEDELSGSFDTTESLTELQVQQFLEGRYYLNLHTELNGPGELRAQVEF